MTRTKGSRHDVHNILICICWLIGLENDIDKEIHKCIVNWKCLVCMSLYIKQFDFDGWMNVSYIHFRILFNVLFYLYCSCEEKSCIAWVPKYYEAYKCEGTITSTN